MASEAPRRASDLASAEATALIGLAALLPRLFVALAWAREPVWDGHYYDFGAQRIAAGLGYSADRVTAAGTTWQPWCHYPVGYSGFLAIAYRLFGGGPHVGPVANAIAGAVLSAVVHRLALRVSGPRRALAAGLLAAALPILVVYTPLLMTEPLAALGTVAAPAAWLWLRPRGRLPATVVAGALLGLSTLVRPQSLLCAPALGVFVWYELRDGAPSIRWRHALGTAAVASAACLAVVAPWTARNCRVMDGCALVSTNGGWNLAIGASPRATGRFEALVPEDGCREVTGQVQQDRCWQARGLAWIAAAPVRWLALAPTKLGHTFDHQSFAVGYLGEANPTAWPEPRRANWRALLAATGRALLIAAALGAVAIPRKMGRRALPRGVALLGVAALAVAASIPEGPGAWPLAVALPILLLGQRHLGPTTTTAEGEGLVAYFGVLIAGICLTHAVFFGEDRYQLVLAPALAVIATRAFSWANA